MAIIRIASLTLLILLGYPGLSRAISAADLLPPEQAFRLDAQAESGDKAVLAWDIAQGYYLYRGKFKFVSKTPGVVLGEPAFPPGDKKTDVYFGDVEHYRGHIQIELPIRRENPSIEAAELEIAYQGCADAGVCFPPAKRTVLLNLPKSAAGVSPPAADGPLARLSQSLKGFGEGALLPPDQAFRFNAEVKDANTLRVSWQIAPGYYLYRDRFHFDLPQSPGAQLAAVDLPPGQIKQEEDGPMAIFREAVDFDLPLERTAPGPHAIRLQAKYQGCAEKGVCYPPMEKTVDLALPATSAATSATKAQPSPMANPVRAAPETGSILLTCAAKLASCTDRIAAAFKTDSTWLVMASFLGFGLLMAFSPCIFPMIPILSGIIVGHGHKITTGRAFLLSLSYVLASAAMYTVFGVLAGLFGANLQAAFQNPYAIGAFSALFVLLSLSMFGFYELQMPSFIQSKVSELSHKQKGGTLAGAAVMGALSALIVGPCMAAPLAGALIYIGQSGDAILGGLALFALGLGMGVPLLLIGLSAGKLLPRAGVWMNAVKAVFGVGMLGVAVWLLDRILPASMTLFLWALLLIVSAIYMSALDALLPGC